MESKPNRNRDETTMMGGKTERAYIYERNLVNTAEWENGDRMK